jgi:hypothetical protein
MKIIPGFARDFKIKKAQTLFEAFFILKERPARSDGGDYFQLLGSPPGITQ